MTGLDRQGFELDHDAIKLHFTSLLMHKPGIKSNEKFCNVKCAIIKHLLDEIEPNIQFIASGEGNIGRSEAEPNIILYGRKQLDVGRGQVQ